MANTYNTGNPVGSTDPRDLKDNASNLDDLLNGPNAFYPSRLGVQKQSWADMQNAFALAQAGREVEFQQFLVDSGFVSLGNYTAGINFTAYNQYMARDGFFYRPAPSSVPFTTTGTWVGGDEDLFVLLSADDVLRQDLADVTVSGNGAGLVAFKQPDIGSVATTVEEKLSERKNAVTDFGADNTGLSDATTALKAFFDACIASGTPGHIPAGDYLVTAGVLAFDTPFIDALWPDITTDGYSSVTFLRADATDAPMISITNGTATSGVGKYWRGGSIGGITFDQNGQAVAANQHGLSLRGIWGTKFGWMRSNDLGGSGVVVPEQLFSVTNPDPYAVTYCTFDGIEANRCKRFGLENNNWLGFNGCRIEALRVIQCEMGGWYGFGTANVVNIASMGSNKGWSFDDGTNLAATGGAPLRTIVNMAELDDQQYGIRLNRQRQADFKFIRFVHRYNFSALNTDNKYWPLKAVELAGGASAATSEISMNVFHRIEAGGTKPDIGVFIDGSSSANAQNILIEQRVFDNAGFGFNDSDLYANISGSSVIELKNAGETILDTRVKVAAIVRSTTADTVPNTGWGAAGAKIVFGTELSDRSNGYDTANSWFTVPYSGLYRLSGRIALTVAVGVRIRLGFGADVAGVVTTVAATTSYQVNAGVQHYEISGLALLSAGQRIFLMADQNTGGAVALSAPNSTTADLTWSIEAV